MTTQCKSIYSTTLKVLLLSLGFIFVMITSLYAQQKELCVSYRFEQSFLRLGGENNSEITKNPAYDYNVNTHAFNNTNIREFARSITGKFHDKTQVMSYDTTFCYIRVDYKNSNLLQPVFQRSDGSCLMLLEEPLNLFEWKLSRETKTILGYTCIKATCKFRGRDYVAYFTREIPFKAAPWKFHGLPGVVLEVFSTDKYCRWTTQALKIQNHEKEISHTGMKKINLEQYKDLLKKRKQKFIETTERNILRFPQYRDSEICTINSILINNIEIFEVNQPIKFK
ncbi:GLPGLI family protein [Marinifilum sp.]|uniref:GLPGLI family protein n=1 Tax=Marinifilum sp. TaxID=2033137 RepID=UPI003BA97CE6